MRKQDLFRLCLQNLLRKRSRTFLTVLGVVIGGCSIVIMVSLGIGMKEAQDKLLAELGDLTIITVNAPQGGRGKGKLDDPQWDEPRTVTIHLTEEQGAYFLEEEELLTIDRNLVPYAGEEE